MKKRKDKACTSWGSLTQIAVYQLLRAAAAVLYTASFQQSAPRSCKVPKSSVFKVCCAVWMLFCPSAQKLLSEGGEERLPAFPTRITEPRRCRRICACVCTYLGVRGERLCAHPAHAGPPKNNGSPFRRAPFPLKNDDGTINTSWPAPSTGQKGKRAPSPGEVKRGKSFVIFFFFFFFPPLSIIFVVILKNACLWRDFFFIFIFLCLPGKTHTVDAPLAEPLTRRSFECLRYDFTFAHINADLNAFHIWSAVSLPVNIPWGENKERSSSSS